jgi:hypothetical protein
MVITDLLADAAGRPFNAIDASTSTIALGVLVPDGHWHNLYQAAAARTS